MGIRKITFDNGDIVLARDQAILYDLLLKQQTKTLLPNGENIYQNSTGFLIQNESEKLKYTHKITNKGVELTFNPQLYLSIWGRIFKLGKDSKYFFNWNDIENNETYYIVVRVDLSKEAKIINGELKEFGNPVEVKLINKKENLIQNNLNQKSDDGIYEFPLVSFIKKYNSDNSWEIKTKDKSTYLLLLLMKSTRNPSKPQTITPKIEEEKENIENYLIDLKHQKIKELNELENLMQELIKIPKNNRPQIPENSNWKLILDVNDEQKNAGKTYIGIFGNKPYVNITSWKGIEGEGLWHLYQYKAIYRWDGKNNPNIPKINKNTGEIWNWNEKMD